MEIPKNRLIFGLEKFASSSEKKSCHPFDLNMRQNNGGLAFTLLLHYAAVHAHIQAASAAPRGLVSVT